MLVVSIVEGHGEVQAVPIVLRRLAESVGAYPKVLPGIRVPKGKLLKRPEFERTIRLAAKRVGASDPICIVLDADDECPAQVGPNLLSWAHAALGPRPITVVLAKREFEAWFLASAAELADLGRLRAGTAAPADPETIRDAKGWLSEAMGSRYSETIDQPALAAVFHLPAARSCRSFVKLADDFLDMLAQPGG